MRATLYVKDKEELKRMIERKRPIVINVPKLPPDKVMFALLIAIFVLSIGGMVVFHSVGYNTGLSVGYDKGHDDGYNQAVQEVMNTKSLSLYDALSWNLRLHFDKYVTWFGIVIGFAWVIHGVGFTIIKTG